MLKKETVRGVVDGGFNDFRESNSSKGIKEDEVLNEASEGDLLKATGCLLKKLAGSGVVEGNLLGFIASWATNAARELGALNCPDDAGGLNA